ncbi:MAG: ClC family H(+)/Cl(-) exchange transporter [Clostridia bacterium]|nr:ClC family H(+)/Cl(-) exchange transporter [Clostridia bacterium]
MKNGKLQQFFRKELQLLLVGICTGLFVGVVVTFYNVAANIITAYSKDLYTAIQEHPAFVPLLFVVLAISAFGIATLVRFVPMVRGSGIPQTEGASRGLLSMKWYQVLPSMAAASLYCMFCGLAAGSEGPSMFIGGACGDGVSSVLGGSDMERRYQITGGACAGLAVAFNAPLTGILFAFEEAHRRFTPSIFICAFSSVLTAIITRNALFTAMNMPVTEAFEAFVFTSTPLPITGYLFVALAAVISGLFGVGFYKFAFLLRKLFSKITVLHGAIRMLIPFLFAGVVGLITVYAMGGGHTLIEALGTHGTDAEMSVKSIFGSPIVVTLIIVLVLRLLSTAINLGAGVPCGIFIPMLALGACIGALISKLCGVMGMNAIYSDCIVMISMATFFTAVVKAPLTSIVMVVELTWQFTLLVPVILGVSIGYMISEVFRLKPLYEAMLETFMDDGKLKLKRRTYSTTVEEGSIATGQAIRDILWPGNLLIRSIKRDGVLIVPASDTVLLVGDEISAQAETTSLEILQHSVDEIVKPRTNTLSQKIKGLFDKMKKNPQPEQPQQTETPETNENPETSGTNENVESSKPVETSQNCENNENKENNISTDNSENTVK